MFSLIFSSNRKQLLTNFSILFRFERRWTRRGLQTTVEFHKTQIISAMDIYIYIVLYKCTWTKRYVVNPKSHFTALKVRQIFNVTVLPQFSQQFAESLLRICREMQFVSVFAVSYGAESGYAYLGQRWICICLSRTALINFVNIIDICNYFAKYIRAKDGVDLCI